MDKDALGRKGEALAARHLESLGWRILARRWRSGHNDIDLVALDGHEVVFVEVKTRSGRDFGYPEEAITAKKRQEMRQAAWAFMVRQGWPARPYRLDVVSVLDGGGRWRSPEIRHFRAAVGEG